MRRSKPYETLSLERELVTADRAVYQSRVDLHCPIPRRTPHPLMQGRQYDDRRTQPSRLIRLDALLG